MTNRRKPMISLAVTTALAGTALVGCTGKVAPVASVSAAKAEQALARGKGDKAVTHAEAAVRAAPRDAANRHELDFYLAAIAPMMLTRIISGEEEAQLSFMGATCIPRRSPKKRSTSAARASRWRWCPASPPPPPAPPRSACR